MRLEQAMYVKCIQGRKQDGVMGTPSGKTPRVATCVVSLIRQGRLGLDRRLVVT